MATAKQTFKVAYGTVRANRREASEATMLRKVGSFISHMRVDGPDSSYRYYLAAVTAINLYDHFDDCAGIPTTKSGFMGVPIAGRLP